MIHADTMVAECEDQTPLQVKATADMKEYSCTACPEGMEGSGESCTGMSVTVCI